MVNKMDLVDYQEEVYTNKIKADFRLKAKVHSKSKT
jgi:sulfate adenylyltransferase subunit 1 (EFTu-like GTPase family)